MPKLFNHQNKAVDTALQSGGRHIFGDEMRLGKTAEAIVTLQRKEATNILVVCPAIARGVWKRQLATWWPNEISVGTIDIGLGRKSHTKKQVQDYVEAFNSRIVITSYGLLDKLIKAGLEVKHLVLDEVHWLAHHKAKRTQLLREFIVSKPKLTVYGLTGTPMPNQPLDACGICEVVWPDRFGGVWKNDITWKCKMRYSDGVHNGYGWNFSGVNPLFQDELRERLTYGVSRTVCSEVPELMQKSNVEYLVVPGELEKQACMDDVVTAAMSVKMKYVQEFVDNALMQVSHVCILTYQKKTARALVAMLQEKTTADVFHIDGSLIPEKRLEEIEKARTKSSAVIVATMHSVGIAIDMAFCSHILCCELYPKPDTMAQALRRFSNVARTSSTFITLMAIENSLDERIAAALVNKLDAIDLSAPLGGTEQDLLGSMNSDVEFNKKIALAFTDEIVDPYDFVLDD